MEDYQELLLADDRHLLCRSEPGWPILPLCLSPNTTVTVSPCFRRVLLERHTGIPGLWNGHRLATRPDIPDRYAGCTRFTATPATKGDDGWVARLCPQSWVFRVHLRMEILKLTCLQQPNFWNFCTGPSSCRWRQALMISGTTARNKSNKVGCIFMVRKPFVQSVKFIRLIASSCSRPTECPFPRSHWRSRWHHRFRARHGQHGKFIPSLSHYVTQPFSKIKPETYQPMPSYRVCTTDGILQLTPGLAKELHRALIYKTKEETSS